VVTVTLFGNDCNDLKVCKDRIFQYIIVVNDKWVKNKKQTISNDLLYALKYMLLVSFLEIFLSGC